MGIHGLGHYLILAKGHLDFEINFFFSETIGSLETKFHVQVYESRGMKIYTNELGYMTKMIAMPIYGKNL